MNCVRALNDNKIINQCPFFANVKRDKNILRSLCTKTNTEKTDSILWNSYDIIGALSEVFSSLVRVMLCIIGALSEVFSSLVLPGVF